MFYVHNIISFYHGHLLLCGEACQDISYMKSVLLQWCSKSLTYYLDRKKNFKPKICRIKQVYNWIFMEKIRIGYVLKSADVGTLFSRRNSENSSHTHAITCKHPRTPHTYPLMPADALNLINHIELHVNGKTAERQIEIINFGLINHM